MTVLRGLPLVGIAAALIAVAIWGGNFIVARGLADHIPPVALAFFRWMLGLAVLLPFAIGPIWRQRRLILSDWRMLTLTAFIGITVFNTLIYFAGATTTAIKMALIAGLTPAIIILSDRVMFGTPLTGRKLIGLAVAFSGVAYLVTGGNFASILRDGVTAGDLLMLAAATCFALYSNLLKYRPAAMDSTAHLGVLFAIGLVLLFPAYLWEMGMGRVVVWDRESLLAIGYVGALASTVAFFCWGRAVRELGSGKAALLYYLIPVATAIQAVVLLGEPVTRTHVISFALIVGGIAVARR